MTASLSEIRNQLQTAGDQLLNERDAAAAAGEQAKVAVAEAEFDRIQVVLSSVQTAINQQLALNLDAVAARLQDSVEAQRAIGLATAAATLAALVASLRGSATPPTPSAPQTEPAIWQHVAAAWPGVARQARTASAGHRQADCRRAGAGSRPDRGADHRRHRERLQPHGNQSGELGRGSFPVS